MNEHPILFSGPMVRAILEGRKTQTRRVITPQTNGWNPIQGDKNIWYWCTEADQDWSDKRFCPYGQPGDRLWVRETFAYAPRESFVYRADYDDWYHFSETVSIKTGETMPLVWKPSIHMPRLVSRINLEITQIRVERIQEISELDARAEGIVWQKDFGNGLESRDARIPFGDLWNALNDPRGYGWNDNPWVWVIEFRRL